jgi:hypothetical protein
VFGFEDDEVIELGCSFAIGSCALVQLRCGLLCLNAALP